ncbi:hypothetical protein OPIT5_00235 (plasmid) [Opitutaceae bacterium TAV5]|nr:hypothetical protein OPIT5_00235 [Opitutaceae bacterium TAV5]
MIELIHSRSAGLVLATGQTGSGKSTTLAAIIDHLVETQPIKVITYEAPIETIFRSRKGLVQQHEVGPYGHGHIENFIEAAKSAMREDPDVIMFGELREPEAIRYAVEAAETGHLVFGTLHTGNAEQSISRLITASPGEGKEFFLNSISTALLGVVSQRLIPTREGKLRANYELMIVNEGISGCIARADFNQIKNTMLTGRRDGMFTFEEHLEELFLSKEYSAEEVVRFSPVPRAMLRHLHNRKHITSQQFQLIGRMYGIQNI